MAERAKANRGKRERKRKGNGRGNVGHNSGPTGRAVALQEVTDRWLPKLQAAQAELEKLQEKVRTKRGQLGQLYEAAEVDGLNRRGLRRGLELLRRDTAEVVVEEEQVSRVLRSSGSILVEQYELFPLAKEVKIANPYLAGQQAGREAAPKEPPFAPGTEDFDLWSQGYDSGQQQNMDTFRDRSRAN